MPGTLVAIGLKEPRISAGASGLGSQVSSWLGPPHWKMRMQERARPKPGAFEAVWFWGASVSSWQRALACQRRGRLRPDRAAMPPTRSHSRRLLGCWRLKSRQGRLPVVLGTTLGRGILEGPPVPAALLRADWRHCGQST